MNLFVRSWIGVISLLGTFEVVLADQSVWQLGVTIRDHNLEVIKGAGTHEPIQVNHGGKPVRVQIDGARIFLVGESGLRLQIRALRGESPPFTLILPVDLGIHFSEADGEITATLDDSNLRPSAEFRFEMRRASDSMLHWGLYTLDQSLRLVRWQGRTDVALALGYKTEEGEDFWLVLDSEAIPGVGESLEIRSVDSGDGSYEIVSDGEILGRTVLSESSAEPPAGADSPGYEVSEQIEWVEGVRVFPIRNAVSEGSDEVPFRVGVDYRSSFLTVQDLPASPRVLADGLELVVYENGASVLRDNEGRVIDLVAQPGHYGQSETTQSRAVEVDRTGVTFEGEKIASILGLKFEGRDSLAYRVYSLKWEPQYFLEVSHDEPSVIKVNAPLELEDFDSAIESLGFATDLVLDSSELPRLEVLSPMGSRPSCCWVEHEGRWVHIPLEEIEVVSNRGGDLVLDELTGTLDLRIRRGGSEAGGAFERIAIARVVDETRLAALGMHRMRTDWDPRVLFELSSKKIRIDVRKVELTPVWRDSALEDVSERLSWSPDEIDVLRDFVTDSRVAWNEFWSLFPATEWDSLVRADVEKVFNAIEARTPFFSRGSSESHRYLQLLKELFDEAIFRLHSEESETGRMAHARAAMILAVQMAIVIANSSYASVTELDQSKANSRINRGLLGAALGGAAITLARFLGAEPGLATIITSVLGGGLLGELPWIRAWLTRRGRIEWTYHESYDLNELSEGLSAQIQRLKDELTAGEWVGLLRSMSCEIQLTTP